MEHLFVVDGAHLPAGARPFAALSEGKLRTHAPYVQRDPGDTAAASYALTLGVQTRGHGRSTVLLAFSVGSVLQIGGLAFYPNLSDRFGRRPVMTFGAILGIVSAYPIFWMIASGSTPLLFFGMVIGMPVVQAAIYGPAAAFISEMFSTEYRYTGASPGYRKASTVGGGVSPLIAASLAAEGGFTAVAISRRRLRRRSGDHPAGQGGHEGRPAPRHEAAPGHRPGGVAAPQAGGLNPNLLQPASPRPPRPVHVRPVRSTFAP